MSLVWILVWILILLILGSVLFGLFQALINKIVPAPFKVAAECVLILIAIVFVILAIVWLVNSGGQFGGAPDLFQRGHR